MARKESVVCVEFGRGNLGVEVAGDGDRQYIRAMFADWQKARLQVVADGLADLLTMSVAERRDLAKKMASASGWMDAHPGKTPKRGVWSAAV